MTDLFTKANSNLGSSVVGWLNTRLYDETGDERVSQGWCPTVLDTNGDGVISRPWNEPDETSARRDATQPGHVNVVDFGRDTLVTSFNYGVIPHPTDGSVWFAKPWPMPGSLLTGLKACFARKVLPPGTWEVSA